MSTSYYVETIERITEQMLVEEVLADTENIKTDAISQTDRIKDLAIDYIEKQRQDIVNKLGENGVEKELNKIYATHYSEEFYRQTIANHKRSVTPLQRVFSILNTTDGTKKEIRILNFLFTIERKNKEVKEK